MRRARLHPLVVQCQGVPLPHTEYLCAYVQTEVWRPFFGLNKERPWLQKRSPFCGQTCLSLSTECMLCSSHLTFFGGPQSKPACAAARQPTSTQGNGC